MVRQRRIATLIALVEMALGGNRLTAVEHAAVHEALARCIHDTHDRPTLRGVYDQLGLMVADTSGDFRRRLEQQFEGDYKLRFHLAPPLLAKKNAQGQLVKQEYGSWVFTAFKLMAKLRGLRGTPLDVFGYTAERRGERALIGEYEKTIAGLLGSLDAGNLVLAAEIASIPEHIRGYGHVKEAHLHTAKAREAALLAKWNNPREIPLVQAA